MRVAILAAVFVFGCQTNQAQESGTTARPSGYNCPPGNEAVSFHIKNQSLPPGFVKPRGRIVISGEAVGSDEQRVRFDGCLSDSNELVLRRVVVGRMGRQGVAFNSYYPSTGGRSRDVVKGFREAVFDQDYSSLEITKHMAALGRDQYYVVGAEHEGKGFAIASVANGSAGFVAGTIEPGGNLAEWYGACDSGYDEKPLRHRFGTAVIEGKVCFQGDITGAARSYGLEVTVTDDNKKLPEAKRGSHTFKGKQAREIYKGGYGHHSCWGSHQVELPWAQYRSRDASRPVDNVTEFEVMYKGHPPEKFTEPAASVAGPC